jgi:hypothetical protein
MCSPEAEDLSGFRFRVAPADRMLNPVSVSIKKLRALKLGIDQVKQTNCLLITGDIIFDIYKNLNEG